jgi:hypothetical protein
MREARGNECAALQKQSRCQRGLCEIAVKMPILEHPGLARKTVQCNGLLLAAKVFLLSRAEQHFWSSTAASYSGGLRISSRLNREAGGALA